MRILTNNELVLKQLDEVYHDKLLWIDGDLIAVLVKARDMVHLGWRLVNHPLSSSIKPNQTPYKTLVLVKTKTSLEIRSLQVIEQALASARKLGKFGGGSSKVLQDLQLLDWEVFQSINLRGEALWQNDMT